MPRSTFSQQPSSEAAGVHPEGAAFGLMVTVAGDSATSTHQRGDGRGDAAVTKLTRSEATRESLLAAAIVRFAAVGYEASTTRDIETAAGVKRGLITYHFRNKETLWKAAVEWLFRRMQDDWRETERYARDIDPSSRPRFFVRAYVRLCARHPDLNRLMIQEGKSDDWRLAWLIEHFVRPWYARLSVLLTGASNGDEADGPSSDAASALSGPHGDSRPIEPLHLYYILTGAASLIFAMAPEARQLSGIDPTHADVVDAHADALANLLFPETPA